MKKTKYLLPVLLVLLTCSQSLFSCQLVGIEWEEFKEDSDLIFRGQLIKAEILDPMNPTPNIISYTYTVNKVFKISKEVEGPKVKSQITFEASSIQRINKTVGRVAMVALRKINSECWVLSVDERSCWLIESKMTKISNRVPVYSIPAYLIHNLPKALGSKVLLKKRYGDDYYKEKVVIYPYFKIEENLKKYLNEKDD